MNHNLPALELFVLILHYLLSQLHHLQERPNSFQDKNYGYASAVAICLLIAILLIHLVQTLFFKEKEDK